MDPARLDLLAAGSLPAAWGRLARADPERRAPAGHGPALRGGVARNALGKVLKHELRP
jgi:hypothetical protein